MPRHAVLSEEKLREIISLANRGLSRRAIFAFPASPGADPSTTASPPPHREPEGPSAPESSVADAIRALNSVLPASPAPAGRSRQVIRGRLSAAGPIAQQAVPPGPSNRSTSNRSASNRSA
jgi:hypothetical protein